MRFKKLRAYLLVLRGEYRILHARRSENAILNASAAELIRNTHSIEKGLSIENPRLGFGHKKQMEMMGRIKTLYPSDSPYHYEACLMALGALSSYISYHKEHNYHDEFIDEIERFLNDYDSSEFVSYGGTLSLSKKQMNFNTPEIEKFFSSRHSIRDFAQTPIDENNLRKAIALAQTAPSACNRQGVRTYILSHNKSLELARQLSGIGGFADSVDRFIMVTGKTSAYREDEINQYIVSSSIFAAYLSLTLHLYGFGACIVQQPVTWSKSWSELQNKYSIPEDEQIVCLLAVGNLKETFDAPVSHRIDIDEFCKNIQ